jgi:hypothetical protein
MSYTWFKLSHNLPTDVKLRRFSVQEKWAWVVLLCLASQAKVRGIVTGDNEDIADYCEFSTVQDWLYYRDKLIAKGMIEINPDGHLEILHWTDRQHQKPSDRPEAVRERVSRHRKKKKEAEETPCNAIPEKSNADVSLQIRSDQDQDQDPDPEIDQDLLKSFIPECPEPSIEPLCSADALRDRAPISKTKEPEPAKQETADTFPPLDSQVEKPGAQPKPRTRKKSGGSARKISTPKNHPEQFDAAWDSYRKFCIAVESTVALSQARKEAVREWDKLIEGGDALEAILDGLNFYMEVKRVEHQRKGEAFGISHFCRFLSNRKWETAIAYREQKRSQPAPAKDITANVHADLQDITVLLRQLGRSAVLPPEWQERTGKTFTRQLDAVESDDYVAYLKGELERLAVANP